MRKSGTLALILVAVAALLAVSCVETTDAAITGAVKTKLAADDQVKASEIEVNTTNRVVTLKGNVDSVAAKERAIQIARETSGVLDVKDMISARDADGRGDAPDGDRTLGTTIDDAGITMRVKARLMDDPAVKALGVDVDTRDGVVYLTGKVASESERQRIVEIARTTEGVKDVEANLR